jgi:hypothetical protein
MRLSRPSLAALLLLAIAAAPVAAAPPARADAARAEHERIVRFWTPERMASAKPRDFVRTPTGFKPAAKPEKPPGGGGGGGSAVTGAAWTKGGPVADRVGKVYFTMGGSSYQCSGSVANDGREGFSLVLTAAHCAYDEVATAFASNWIFIPAWGQQSVGFQGVDCTRYDATVYGCWTAQALVVHHGYASAGSFNTQATTHDFAFAVVGPGGKSRTAHLDGAVGSYPISFDPLQTGWRAAAFGYPAAGKYKGNTLTYCAGPTITDAYNGNLTWGVGCDMTGGSSGGPWFNGLNETNGSGGTLSSLNSYGYSGIRNMYGPRFNATTQAVYNAANSATSNTIVGR